MDSDSIKSICMKQTIVGMNCTYSIACKGDKNSLSYCTQFDPSGNGEKLWNDLLENGKLTELVADEHLKGKFRFRAEKRKKINSNANFHIFLIEIR